MSSSPPRTHRLAAVWFADLVGYSTLASQNEPAALRLIDLFQRVAGELVTHYGGRIVKLIGDAALAEFTSTEAAVRSALALQREFASHSADIGLPAQLRIGVHLGDVVSALDGDLYGDGVNITARLQGEAEPGQVLASEDVWRQLRQRPAYRFTALGERSLKGISAPVAVFDVQYEEAEEISPPPSPSAGKGAEASERSATRSIAVLPFVNMSADPENEYFSDGLSEELLNVLAQIPALHVVARTSSFAFKGKNVPIDEIAQRLKAMHVLEGSVRKAGQRVRIAAQLIEARDGYHLWSETYDRELSDIFTLQDEIARAIAAALRVRLGAEEPLTRGRETSSTEAHDLYLRGRYAFHQLSDYGLQRAIGFFEKAIERDPDYAPAHAALAIIYALLPLYLPVPEREAHPKAKAAATRALQIDESLPEAHTALGVVLYRLEWDWNGAERHLKRALELNPSSPETHLFYTEYLTAMGRREEALAHVRRAEELDPLSLFTTSQAALFLYFARDYDAAAERLHRVLEMDPNYLWAHWYLGLVYRWQSKHAEAIVALERTVELSRGADLFRAFLAGYGYAPAGRRAEALAILEDLKAAAEEGRVTPNVLPVIYAGLGDTDRALYWLERVIEKRVIPPHAVRDPTYDSLRFKPGFSRLLKEVDFE